MSDENFELPDDWFGDTPQYEVFWSGEDAQWIAKRSDREGESWLEDDPISALLGFVMNCEAITVPGAWGEAELQQALAELRSGLEERRLRHDAGEKGI